MKRITFLICVLFYSFSCFAKQDLDSTLINISNDIIFPLEKGSIICVLNFDSPSSEMSAYIQDELTSLVASSGRLKIVTRAHMDKVEKELNYQLTGYVSDETALDICQRLGAQSIVFGQLKELNNKYNLQVKIIDVESAAYLLFKSYQIDKSSKSEQLLGRAAIYNKAALGFGLDVNKNSLESIGLGGGLLFDYALFRNFAIGLKILVSGDFFEKQNEIFTIEPLFSTRFYVVSPSGESVTGLFIQGDIGASLIFANSNLNYSLNAGIELGFRQGIDYFYFEPFIRGGYPYLFGVGVSCGVRF